MIVTTSEHFAHYFTVTSCQKTLKLQHVSDYRTDTVFATTIDLMTDHVQFIGVLESSACV